MLNNRKKDIVLLYRVKYIYLILRLISKESKILREFKNIYI